MKEVLPHTADKWPPLRRSIWPCSVIIMTMNDHPRAVLPPPARHSFPRHLFVCLASLIWITRTGSPPSCCDPSLYAGLDEQSFPSRRNWPFGPTANKICSGRRPQRGKREGRARLCGGRTGITFQPCQHAEEEEDDDDDRGGRIDMGALGNLPD